MQSFAKTDFKRGARFAGVARELVAREVLLLAVLFMAALTVIATGHVVLEKRLNAIRTLQKNEQTRVELAYLIHLELQKIENLFQNMFLCRTEQELDFINGQIENSVGNVENFVSVLEKGGAVTYGYRVNFRNEEEIRQTFSYRPHNLPRRDAIHLNIFEMRGKLADLKKHHRVFTELVSGKIRKKGPAPPSVEQKITYFYKGLDPYFQRIFETSWRNYFNARTELRRLNDQLTQTERTFRTLFYLAVAVSGLLIIGLTGHALTNILRILKERSAIQDELKTANETLEQKVGERTENLLRETNERIRAEEKARERADFLKTIIDSLAHPFYVIDTDTYEIVLSNEHVRRLNPGQTSYCYTLTRHGDHPCSGKEHPCPIDAVKREREPSVMEHTHYDRDGNPVYVEVHGHPVFDATGRLTMMIEYSIDITKKKLAEWELEETNRNLEKIVAERTRSLEEEIVRRRETEARLQESEHYYRKIIENSNDLIVIVNREWNVSYISPSIGPLLGYDPEMALLKNPYHFLHPDDARFARENSENFFQAITNYATRIEYRVLAADGSYRFMETSFRDLSDDPAIRGILLIARDITDKKKTEALMNKLRLVVEQSPNSVVITDKDGAIEYVNPRFEKITGYTSAEVLGRNPRILKGGVTPQETYAALWQTITTGNIWRGEFANKNKDGGIYYENVAIAPLKNEAGEIVNFVAIKEDITELKEAYARAEASDRAKSRFLSRMSHELRTPLNAINGFSALIMESRNPVPAPIHVEYAGQINTAGRHLLALINEILDLSRIEAGRLSLTLETINPAPALKNCLALVETLLLTREVTATMDASVENLPPITADATRFNQVILNLLTNAVKYNRPGGTVTIAAGVENGMASIRVADTGIGIPPEKQNEVFTPFARLGQETLAVEGTGIGLAITKQLVEMMGGTITFESIPGSGSTFCVSLPFAVGQPAPQTTVDEEATDIAEDPAPHATILYVEDDAVNILLMKSIMERWPLYTLIVRKTAEKGIEAVELFHPDIVLMDLTLPDFSGMDAFLAIRRIPGAADMPIIAISADCDDNTVRQCMEMGFHDFIAKPVDMKTLGNVLSQAVRRKKP